MMETMSKLLEWFGLNWDKLFNLIVIPIGLAIYKKINEFTKNIEATKELHRIVIGAEKQRGLIDVCDNLSDKISQLSGTIDTNLDNKQNKLVELETRLTSAEREIELLRDFKHKASGFEQAYIHILNQITEIRADIRMLKER